MEQIVRSVPEKGEPAAARQHMQRQRRVPVRPLPVQPTWAGVCRVAVLIPPPVREALPTFDATATNGNGAPAKGVSRLTKPLKAFGYTVCRKRPGWL